MGLFRKKPDPISERSRALSAEIAALEAQIKKLSAQEKKPGLQQPELPVQTNHHPKTQPPAPAPSRSSQPRLRSTAMPHYRHAVPAPPAPAAPPREPVFEEVNQSPLQSKPPPRWQASGDDLGVRKTSLGASWRRLKNHFRGPPTSNPKLVNYLAAGSIQGLRPLRYERRVARNRFLVLVLVLVLVL